MLQCERRNPLCGKNSRMVDNGMPADELLPVSVVARILGVTRTTILRWIEKGHLAAVQFPSGMRRVSKRELKSFLHDSRDHRGKYRVMVIDDEEIFLNTLTQMLESLDVPLEVAAYTDGLRALLDIAEIRPHAIIIDYLLPSVDGGAITTRIRENPEYRDVALIMISGMVDSLEETGCQGDAFLHKPFSISQLETVLKTCLHIGKATPEPALAAAHGPGPRV
ncbi:MAG: response regulator [Chitinivibrionales bacterium]|nr:response regulator [Chitinivibrionales bacterium]